MKKKALGILMTSVCTLGLLAGCGSGGGDKENESAGGKDQVELSLMFSGGDQNWKKSVENVAAKYMEKNQDVKIKLEPSGSGVYNDFLKTKDAVGEFGDIVELKEQKTYAKSNKIVEMPSEIVDLVETAIEIDGKVYSTPTATNTQGIIYNKAIFKDLGLEEPKTYADFLDICEKIKKSGVDPLVVGASDLWHMGFWTNHFFRNDVLKDNMEFQQDRTAGEVSWTDPEPTKMINDLKNLFDKKYVQDGFMSTADNQTAAILTSGTAAMLYSGPWMFAQLDEADKNFDYGFFFLPAEDGTLNVFSDNGSGWGISSECAKDEEKYAAAQDFLKFFYSKDIYAETLKSMSILPITKEKVTYEASPVQEKLIETFQSDSTNKININLGDQDTPDGFRDYMYKVIQEIILGETSVDEGLKNMDTEWDKMVTATEQ